MAQQQKGASMPEALNTDRITIQRVANGWILMVGSTAVVQYNNQGLVFSDTTHVAATPDVLADHVRRWAALQIAPLQFNGPDDVKAAVKAQTMRDPPANKGAGDAPGQLLDKGWIERQGPATKT
jgi:hypothetical protein